MVLLHNKLSLGLEPADTRVHKYPFNDSDQIYQDKSCKQTSTYIFECCHIDRYTYIALAH